MSEWQNRVIEERNQLREKIRKLVVFLYAGPGEALDEFESALLRDQLSAMTEYDSALSMRIRRFD
jgi:hypothetical protein